MAVLAVQTIRRMRGGAQSQLMLGADGRLWVVKFRNNPQGERVLANELIATRLAEAVGLTVPQTDVVEVSAWLIQNSPEMWVDAGRGERVRCAEGLAFGSLFVGGLMPGQVVDYLPEEMLPEVRNVEEFAGMLCIDKWTGNSNGRQAVFSRKPRERRYRATFIDQGFCFNAHLWNFPDSPLRGVYARNRVYDEVTGWESFEPWLGRIEAMEAEAIFAVAEEAPPEWYGGETEPLERLVETMYARRGRVRELIAAFRDSDRRPFPKWGRSVSVAVPGQFAEGAMLSNAVAKYVM